MLVPLYHVDAFASTAFTGNPAAVCLLSTDPGAEWMQRVAGEMNLSETAFLRPQADGSYRLRWFTPTHEVDLCGHATLAGAHMLWTEGALAPDADARFHTESGRLVARRDQGWIRMDFPADPVEAAEAPETLLNGLGGLTPDAVGRSGRDYLVELSDADAVRTLDPDLSALAALDGIRGVIVTAAHPAAEESRSPAVHQPEESPSTQTATDEIDFVSRFFAPGVGVPEDPVTGSSHCALGPYWAEKMGRTSLTGRQVSDRGGTVRVHLEAPDAERVTLAGQATTVVRGRLDA